MLLVCSSATTSRWVGCPQGKPKDEKWCSCSFFFFFLSGFHACSKIIWGSSGWSVWLQLPTSAEIQKKGEVHQLVLGMHNQVIHRLLCDSCLCHWRGWSNQTRLASFYCFKFTLYPTSISREAGARDDHTDELVLSLSLTFMFCSKSCLYCELHKDVTLHFFSLKSLYLSLISLKSCKLAQNWVWGVCAEVFPLVNTLCPVQKYVFLYVFKCQLFWSLAQSLYCSLQNLISFLTILCVAEQALYTKNKSQAADQVGVTLSSMCQ